jgi:hypothetical protein
LVRLNLLLIQLRHGAIVMRKIKENPQFIVIKRNFFDLYTQIKNKSPLLALFSHNLRAK